MDREIERSTKTEKERNTKRHSGRSRNTGSTDDINRLTRSIREISPSINVPARPRRFTFFQPLSFRRSLSSLCTRESREAAATRPRHVYVHLASVLRRLSRLPPRYETKRNKDGPGVGTKEGENDAFKASNCQFARINAPSASRTELLSIWFGFIRHQRLI